MSDCKCGARGPRGFPGGLGATGVTGATGPTETLTPALLNAYIDNGDSFDLAPGARLILNVQAVLVGTDIAYNTGTGTAALAAGTYEITFGGTISGLGALAIRVDGTTLPQSRINASQTLKQISLGLSLALPAAVVDIFNPGLSSVTIEGAGADRVQAFLLIHKVA